MKRCKKILEPAPCSSGIRIERLPADVHHGLKIKKPTAQVKAGVMAVAVDQKVVRKLAVNADHLPLREIAGGVGRRCGGAGSAHRAWTAVDAGGDVGAGGTGIGWLRTED